MNLAPRLGVVYRLRENLVVRAGYGTTYLPSNTGYYDGPFNYGMQPFAATTDVQLYGANPAGSVVGDFAAVTRIVQPTNADPQAPALYGSPNPRFDLNGFKSPTAHQVNAFFEWQKPGWQFAAGWSGAFGRKLATGGIDAVNNDQYMPDATLSTWRDNYLSRNATGHTGTDQVNNPSQPAAPWCRSWEIWATRVCPCAKRWYPFRCSAIWGWNATSEFRTTTPHSSG